MTGAAPAERQKRAVVAAGAAALLGAVALVAVELYPGRRLPVEDNFPPALVRFVPYPGNPVFTGTGADTWDRTIRERGSILFEEGQYRLYYTGYNESPGDAHRTAWPALGLATSPDGYRWTRQGDGPIFSAVWTEDVYLLHDEHDYYVVAEGKDDIAHALSSEDGVHFKELGPLDIRKKNGQPLPRGPYGTPTVWRERGLYYLFYERSDEGIWLATSKDRASWTNVDDEPVIPRGPDAYDRYGVALDQIVRYEGRFYAYYHANAARDLEGPWTTSIAVSDDLLRWKKYAHNPVLSCDCSSAVLVEAGGKVRLYTTHPDVRVFLPAP